jgi:hypothetical protein
VKVDVGAIDQLLVSDADDAWCDVAYPLPTAETVKLRTCQSLHLARA